MRWVQLCGSLRILWHCPSLRLTFSSPVATAVFQICWCIECSTFTASSFRILNSSVGIPSRPLSLFAVMLPKAHLTLHSRMSGSRWVITPLWLLESLIPLLSAYMSSSLSSVVAQISPYQKCLPWPSYKTIVPLFSLLLGLPCFPSPIGFISTWLF